MTEGRINETDNGIPALVAEVQRLELENYKFRSIIKEFVDLHELSERATAVCINGPRDSQGLFSRYYAKKPIVLRNAREALGREG